MKTTMQDAPTYSPSPSAWTQRFVELTATSIQAVQHRLKHASITGDICLGILLGFVAMSAAVGIFNFLVSRVFG